MTRQFTAFKTEGQTTTVLFTGTEDAYREWQKQNIPHQISIVESNDENQD